MTSPWLEDWVAGEPTENGESYACVYVTVGSDLRLEADDWRGQSDAGKEAVAKLAAAAPALVRALLAVEWGLRNLDPEQCAVCCDDFEAETAETGHAVGCPVDAALTAAGLATQASRDEARKAIAAMPAR